VVAAMTLSYPCVNPVVSRDCRDAKYVNVVTGIN